MSGVEVTLIIISIIKPHHTRYQEILIMHKYPNLSLIVIIIEIKYQQTYFIAEDMDHLIKTVYTGTAQYS